MLTDVSSDSDDHRLNYSWYRAVTDRSLEQGDLFLDFPIVSLAEPVDFAGIAVEAEIGVRVSFGNVVVLTQSCDLEAGKVDNVLICPHFTIAELEAEAPDLKSSRVRRQLKNGLRPSLYPLPPCELDGFERETHLVNFRQLTSVPFARVEQFAQEQSPRVRLLPPYREHLAQALGRFLGRTALPIDYPDF